MKICIIGNSHTGALKRAWDDLIDTSLKTRYEVTFFAARADSFKDLELKGQSLVPKLPRIAQTMEFTSGGLSSIDCNNYDLFLLYGLKLEPFFVDTHFHSKAVLEACIHDTYSPSKLGYKLLTMIREVVESKIYIGHNPLLTDASYDDIIDGENLVDQYTPGIDLANSVVFKHLNAELIKQPAATLVGAKKYTHSKFSKGSKRLEIRSDTEDKLTHRSDDNTHMNDEFGKIWLEEFLQHVANNK